MDAEVRGRQAVRPRWRRRRLRGVRIARRDRRAAGAEASACALRRHHRDLRGIRQLRPAALPRAARTADRGRRLRHRPRFGLRRLRAAVGHDVAARARCGNADRTGARRGRALGRCERRRAVVVSHAANAARPPRGSRYRSRARAPQLHVADSRRARATGARRGGHPRRRRLHQVSVRGRRQRPMVERPRRGAAQSHLAAGAVGDRRRRPCRRSQTRATCCARRTSLKLSMRLPPIVDGRDGDGGDEDAARSGSAVRRNGHVRAPSRAQPAGTRSRRRRGCRLRSQAASQTFYAKPRRRWARAERFRSWACWASSFRRHSS